MPATPAQAKNRETIRMPSINKIITPSTQEPPPYGPLHQVTMKKKGVSEEKDSIKKKCDGIPSNVTKPPNDEPNLTQASRRSTSHSPTKRREFKDCALSFNVWPSTVDKKDHAPPLRQIKTVKCISQENTTHRKPEQRSSKLKQSQSSCLFQTPQEPSISPERKPRKLTKRQEAELKESVSTLLNMVSSGRNEKQRTHAWGEV